MKKVFEIGKTEYSFASEEDVNIDFSLVESSDGVSLYKVRFDWEKECCPKKIVLTYSFPCVDMYGLWDPLSRVRHIVPSWVGESIAESRVASGMPLKAIFSKKGDNAYLMTVSDVKSPISIKFGGSHQTACIEAIVSFFTALTGPFSSYEALIRIDERRIPFVDAIKSARGWFDSLGYKCAYVPEYAKKPMYSTWYAYTQSVTAKETLKQCKKAAKLGMKTVIVDDGWQTPLANGTYDRCGDWEPARSKFPNMEKFVEQIHALGMKVMLWYSVPFVGWYAKKYKEFEGMYLNDVPGCNCSVLDPRYKKVREYLVNTYVDAAKKWKLDGFKLDFIDRFRTNGKVTPEMDFVAVEDAVECLLSEIHDGLTKINPEMLLEFRQPYYGPVVGAYGNMFRVWDCPLDGVTNKTWSTNLRLVMPDSAVHSDMIYWHKEETPEGISAQLFGTLFAVPQISTRFDLITKEHEGLIKNYLSFWNEHSDTLCDGDFKVRFTENGFSCLESTLNGEKIALASAGTSFEIGEGIDKAYLFNITDENSIILKIRNAKKYDYEVFDCKGARVNRKRLVRNTVSEIEVPFGGMLKVSLH